jgi:hypothetical protein
MVLLQRYLSICPVLCGLGGFKTVQVMGFASFSDAPTNAESLEALAPDVWPTWFEANYAHLNLNVCFVSFRLYFVSMPQHLTQCEVCTAGYQFLVAEFLLCPTGT